MLPKTRNSLRLPRSLHYVRSSVSQAYGLRASETAGALTIFIISQTQNNRRGAPSRAPAPVVRVFYEVSEPHVNETIYISEIEQFLKQKRPQIRKSKIITLHITE